MALAATLVGEVRTGGADTNGGFFKTGASGTDYSQQNSAQFTGTNMTVDPVSNTKVTPDGHTPAAADVGNTVYFAFGVGWTVGLFEITAQDGVEWTLDRSPAAIGVTGGVWAMGGAKASPGAFGRDHVAGNDGWVAGGTYTVTSATANIAAGCVTLAGAASAANGQSLEGYQSSRGDLGTKPVVKADSVITTFTLITSGAASRLRNLEVDGNSRTSSKGVTLGGGAGGWAFGCRARNCTNTGIAGNTTSTAEFCEATTCSTQPAFLAGSHRYNLAYSNTITGFSLTTAQTTCYKCISVNNTGASSDGFSLNASPVAIVGCVAYTNGRDGFRFSAASAYNGAECCIAVSNTGVGFNADAAFDSMQMFNNAYFSNGTNVSANVTSGNNIGGILLTADPFTNAAGSDFSLNNTAGGGAACRAAGIPTASGTYALQGVSTPSYPDVGAAQSLAACGSDGGTVIMLGRGLDWNVVACQ